MSEIVCQNPQLQSPLNRSSKDKFILLLELPYILRKRASEDPSLNIKPLQISVHGAVVPDISVPEVDVRYAGQTFHLSTYTRPNYPPLTVNFIVDNNYENWFLLWKWLEVMNTAVDSYYGGDQNKDATDKLSTGSNMEYQANFSIFALNEYNQTVLEFFYTQAFISSLGGINYSYRDGEILESTAQFHFSQLYVKKLPQNTI